MDCNANDVNGRSSLLTLASASPRRRSLLREHGYTVTVVTPKVEEPHRVGEGVTPEQRAEALSYFKASSAVGLVREGTILAGDTVVALGNRVFGKPADRDDARRILSSLAGTTHRVITGVTLLDPKSRHRLIQHESTTVTFRPLSDQEIERYLDSGDWADKAGAYGIQDHGDAFVERIDGSFTNVVGLPMELLSRMLARWAQKEPTSAADPKECNEDPPPERPRPNRPIPTPKA